MDVKYRIGNFTAVVMLVSAMVLELIQGLLDLTVFLALGAPVLTLIAAPLFSFWFMTLKVNYSKNMGTKVLTGIGTFAIEMIPEIDIVPGVTVWVGTMILQSRAEDREKAKKHAAASGAQATRAQRIQAMQAARLKANDNEAEEELAA